MRCDPPLVANFTDRPQRYTVDIAGKRIRILISRQWRDVAESETEADALEIEADAIEA